MDYTLFMSMSSGQLPDRARTRLDTPFLDDGVLHVDTLTPQPIPAAEPPLCVDLDGTLIKTDTLLEACAILVKAGPAKALLLLPWAFRGPAYLKAQLAARVVVDPAMLPYNERLLERLRRERSQGRRLVLVTAADTRVAERIADFLGIFDQVIGSDGGRNLKGAAKRDVLVEHFGSGRFDYAGNARADLAVWSAARSAIVVNATAAVANAAPPDADRTLASRPSAGLALVRALRPHQWSKNLLILLPLLLSHRILDAVALKSAILAIVAFCLCASGIYLINDVLDAGSDRTHRSKRRRPIACGDLGIGTALVVAPILIAAALATATTVSPPFTVVVIGYLGLTLAYSLKLKRIVLLDVVVLAALYASRLVAGGVAAHVVASFWLLAFALFMFSSLAMLKRYSELVTVCSNPVVAISGRDYTARDADMIAMLGVGCGLISVLVVALYIHGDLVQSLYAHPSALWSICPLLLYWISRTWLIAHRGAMNDDPILFVLKDRPSLVVAGLCLATGVLATLKIAFPF
jgi:4-hydroxybenzoate polyprenyltransferase/phosphoserine phosphatase